MRAPPSAPLPLSRTYPVLAYLKQQGVGKVQEVQTALDIAARLRRDVIDDVALEVDARAGADPYYVARDVVAKAGDAGWFSLPVPRLFGGGGLPLGAVVLAIEELAAGCLGLANLLNVHGLALCTIAATGALGAMEDVSRRLVRGEREHRPELLSTCITEPGAGTDTEDIELLRTARITSEARPVPGGYRLNGRKVFISNGSIATTHVVFMPTDRSRPAETTCVFLVDGAAPGVEIVRVEHKMGQRGCPAAELSFEDCFVPEEARLGPVSGRTLRLLLGATRGGVGVFGVGVARGAYERALRYAKTHLHRGRPLIDHQWARFRLVEMETNVRIARAACVDAVTSNELLGLAGAFTPTMMERALAHVPPAVADRLGILRSRSAKEGFAQRIDELSTDGVCIASALGSNAKVVGSDLGVRNCELALDLMGSDGLRHDEGVEKLFRDARLLQIYEGTNELNRLEMYTALVDPGASLG